MQRWLKRRVLNSDQGKVMREFGSGVGEEGVLGSNHDESVDDKVRKSCAELKKHGLACSKMQGPANEERICARWRGRRGVNGRRWAKQQNEVARGSPAAEREHGRKC